MTGILATWNALPSDEATATILPCCGSCQWAERLAAHRPFSTAQALAEASDTIWRSLPEQAWLEAFATHPRLGQRHAPSATPESLSWSAAEQSHATIPGEAARSSLAQANHLYEQRFGRTFILCATGKTAPEILETLNRRLRNTPEQEMMEAAEQQRQITQLRLRKWLGGQP